MGDLISRSALIEQLRAEGRLTFLIKGAIDNQPTAYDVEKVVEELEENGQKMSEAKGNPWDSSDHKYYKAISVKKAIGIVRKGGVENGNINC